MKCVIHGFVEHTEPTEKWSKTFCLCCVAIQYQKYPDTFLLTDEFKAKLKAALYYLWELNGKSRTGSRR